MIRVLILEPDPMVGHLLEEMLLEIADAELIGIVGTVEELNRNTADLIIGEIELRDGSLYQWILDQRLHKTRVDFIPVTGNHDYDICCQCIRAGAFDYVLKPFEKTRVKTAVQRYIKWKKQWIPDEGLMQSKIDAYFYPGILHGETAINLHTYRRIQNYIDSCKKGWFTARESALEMKMSPVTMRRYLDVMYQHGYLKIQTQYGKVGRPTYLYCRKEGGKSDAYNDCSNTE